ncbi:hypothetical protein Tco_1128308, partial [Tanacetum coccineum]
EIVEKINSNAYRLKLPSHIRCSDVFNVKHLIPYHGDSSDDDLAMNSRTNFVYPGGNDGGPSIEERADLFLEAQDRVKKRASSTSDFLYDFKVVDGGSQDVTHVPGLRRSLILLDTLEKEGHTVKMQTGRVKVIKGFRVMMTGIRKNNRVYTLLAKVINFGVKKHGDSKQVGFKQLHSKQVGFKQLGPDVETGVHGVHIDKLVWFEVEPQGAQENREFEVF